MSKAHLILAHLVLENSDYRNYWSELHDGKDKILDNSAFEMFTRGQPLFPPDKLLEVADMIGPDYLVMSDYPGEPGRKTIDEATKLIPKFEACGYKTFFVPQSKFGETNDYIETFDWGLQNSDRVGVSILGAPNAFGCKNDMQSYLSRFHLMGALVEKGILDRFRHHDKLHFLGMLGGPNEIDLVRPFHHYIGSWDSSSASWNGLNGIVFDGSPTGLLEGKLKKEVDFNYKCYPFGSVIRGEINANIINRKCL